LGYSGELLSAGLGDAAGVFWSAGWPFEAAFCSFGTDFSPLGDFSFFFCSVRPTLAALRLLFCFFGTENFFLFFLGILSFF